MGHSLLVLSIVTLLLLVVINIMMVVNHCHHKSGIATGVRSRWGGRGNVAGTIGQIMSEQAGLGITHTIDDDLDPDDEFEMDF